MVRSSKKQNRSLKRKGQTRNTNDRVLIVCEGEKTEPYYLQGLLKHEKLTSFSLIDVTHTDGRSAPIHVVERAIELEAIARRNPNVEAHYNRVYCIFDQDQHSTLQAAINKFRDHDKKTKAKCQTIVSYPSFEYWYLCHFSRSRAPIVTSAECEKQTNRMWRTHFKEPYHKNSQNIYHQLKPFQSDAIKNAKFAIAESAVDGELNPSTQVCQLVEDLLNFNK